MKSLQQIMGGQAGWSLAGALMVGCVLMIPSTLSASVFTLTESQRARIPAVVASDPEAAKQFRNILRKADAALVEVAHPASKIQSAGRLANDPVKRSSMASLEDMKKLYALAYAGALTTNNAYHAAVRRVILQWAEVNEPTGQPIDETKLEPLFSAYDLARCAFSASERKQVDAWLRRIAREELQSIRATSITASNNWQSHRLKILGTIGFLLDDRDLIERAVSGFKQQVADDLRRDGSSLDFHHRDSLRYHCYTLEPLLTLALAARQNDIDLYGYQAPSGASLSNSIRFLVPYCDGSKIHAEFVHTRAGFDRARGEAGEKGFVAGEPFNPRDARGVFDLAYSFDEQLKPLALRLHGGSATNYPNWQSVLNQVRK